MGVIPNPKMAFIFPISCILALIFPILIKYFPKCVGKGSFPKSQIKSLHVHVPWRIITRSNGGPGSFEYYFNGGKILCVYMYIGDYFYR